MVWSCMIFGRPYSRKAKDTGETIIQGPFDLVQGGKGIALRHPVYKKDWQPMLASGQEMVDPEIVEFQVLDTRLKLAIMPAEGWSNYREILPNGVFGFFGVLLFTAMSYMLLRLAEAKRMFSQMSLMDGLTGLRNKRSFDLSLEHYLRQYTDRSASCRVRQPDKEELENIFNSMLKHTEASRKIDCECCGYETCEKMAIAIYNGFNKKENCIH